MDSFYFCGKLFQRIVFLGFISILSFKAIADVHPKQEEANKTISELYHNLNNIPKSDMAARLEAISAQFLGKEYLLGALGEGKKARFDQAPRYRTDAFDCDTYVTTVLAIALASDTNNFKQCMCRIRYENGHVTYTNRNHFTSLDWNKNNQLQGFVKDITTNFKDANNKPVALIATALIDKPSWYQHLSIKNIRLYPQNDEKEQLLRLTDLKNRGNILPKTNSQLPYIPLTALFDAKGAANQFLFSQIPNASIIEIVRPNWNLKEAIGTNLNVSHLGFAFWKNGVLYFREASSVYGQVVDVPMIDYLKEALNSPTIKGINVQIVVPQAPLPNGCSSTN
ncbi:N-acetylmuramoyl-L-alanine amidase-like domain-containing protein [Legionella hackeliae]|uniref:DUF1460 domain-containing protein n=1 Tax=Legionella hackeliae TaxID=449 RepID=A0A0A8UXD9_LEGHA|nr:N-acetylmuramoyl-L-alanine amidase-like domain-containing protein [Legionella hackeliae]KTD09910.1 hypothetical protein Lhac_2278 [Legionella hackeliae]CEK11787.1 conserved protein of unknown function [Legionella hackeliae]STX48558.1 Protein of uncharacterised function (DUF1460) [Legionella hackeliae]